MPDGNAPPCQPTDISLVTDLSPVTGLRPIIMNVNVSPTLNVMIIAARKAGRSLTRDFGEVENLQVSLKGPANFVSAADLRAEEIIFRELNKTRPGYGFLMEERGKVDGADSTHRWIVDPLDGTTNFLHANPLFAISIGLEREGQLVAGVIYNPVSDELFTAEKGKGAFMNDRRLRVAGRKKLADALITTGMPHRGRPGHEQFKKELDVVMPEVAGLRRSGSAALDLAFVAAGRYDAYWEHNLQAWDLAAGIVIAREAGARVTQTNGKEGMLESGDILVANPTMHKLVADLLAKAG